ncbi:MAG: hypothetical protein NTY06_00240, partial [Candidatus Gottesmanbacteria bacterium]|nr:hypothetical protein [Candidatus Gottesmanbacteria bacterium]
KPKKSEKLILKEPAPWFLFAIIWYLAMIRESRGAGSGYAGQGKKKKAKKQIIQYYPTPIPQQGVIFAFAS